MNTRIALFGATGAVGSALLVHLLKASLLKPGDEIILVGRGTPESQARLLAIRTDLLDAFEDTGVDLVVCESLEALTAEVFVMAAGATLSTRITSRQALADGNLPLFEDVAERLARTLPQAFFLIISNPVELAVSAFCKHLDPKRVVGMGAQQDSLRFARAIAAKLGVPRSSVRASVLGGHGEGMVPVWSSVYLANADEAQTARLTELRAAHGDHDQRQAAGRTREEALRRLAHAGGVEAYRFLEGVAPDLRIMVEPIVTFQQLHSTPNATANAALDCLSSLVTADERKIHGQVLLQGEYYDVAGVCGAPICLRRNGWHLASADPLTEAEAAQLRAASTAINAATEGVYGRFRAAKTTA